MAMLRVGNGSTRVISLLRARWTSNLEAIPSISSPSTMEASLHRVSAKCARPAKSCIPRPFSNLNIRSLSLTSFPKPKGGLSSDRSNSSWPVGMYQLPSGAIRDHASTKASRSSFFKVKKGLSSLSTSISKRFWMITAMKRFRNTKVPRSMKEMKNMSAATVEPQSFLCGGASHIAPLKHSCMIPFQDSPVVMRKSMTMVK
mmetsp:Transcript_136967/g.255807  ORF Transcript_136967/g.255807 Transcript_136967/m.255807 type:complete len:201 (+) Transcript_136967:792-1394(+)